MRSLVYGVAVLAAIGIMVGIIMTPSGPGKADRSAPGSASTAPAVTSMSSPGKVVLNVPEMMCEFACFPRIKETLEGDDAVSSVELAAQKEEGTLDNKQVIVSYKSGFDPSGAIELLDKSGFANSSVAQDSEL